MDRRSSLDGDGVRRTAYAVGIYRYFLYLAYPLSVGVVWMFRKKNPVVALFPCMNFVVFAVALFVRP